MRYTYDLKSVARDVVHKVRPLHLNVLNSRDERDEEGQKCEDPMGIHGCDVALLGTFGMTNWSNTGTIDRR